MVFNINEVYNINKILDNSLMTRGGDISYCYELDLPEIYSLSPKDFDEVHSELERFMKNLPVSVLHKQDIYLKKDFTGTNLNDNTYLQQITKKKFLGRKYLDHQSYMYITQPNIKSLKSSFLTKSFINKGGVINQDAYKVMQFKKGLEHSIALLGNSNYISIKPMEEYQLQELVYYYYTGFNNGNLTDIIFRPEFMIGGNYYRMYAISRIENQPEIIRNCMKNSKMSTDKFEFYQSYFYSMGLDLDCNHIVNQVIYLDDHMDLKKEIKKAHRGLKRWQKFNENEQGYKDINEFLDGLNSDDRRRLCRAHINILAWSDDEREIKEIDSLISSKLRNQDIIPYCPSHVDHAYYFLSSVPGNAASMPREETFITEVNQSINYIILESNYKSDNQGIVLNERLNNLPIVVDDWDYPYEKKIITARNELIITETGGGKSFLLKHKIRQYIEEGYYNVVIDLGGGFEPISKLYPEVAFIRFEQGKPLGVNPFLIRDKAELTSEKIRTLSEFVFILWKKDLEANEEERVSMNKLIQAYYDTHSDKYHFPSFYKFIKDDEIILRRLGIEEEFFPREKFLHVCSEFTEGIYSFLFEDNKQSYYLKDKKNIVFELESIRGNTELIPIILMMIRDTVDNVVWKNTTGKKRVTIEEAAEIMQMPVMLRTISYWNQTIRKHSGCTSLILQHISNIPENEMGKQIIENAQVYYIFEQKKGTDEIKRRLGLSEHTINQLMSVQSNFTSGERYTEFLRVLGRKANVYRLVVAPQAKYVYDSEKKDVAKVLKEYEKTGSMEKAIENLYIKEHEN